MNWTLWLEVIRLVPCRHQPDLPVSRVHGAQGGEEGERVEDEDHGHGNETLQRL